VLASEHRLNILYTSEFSSTCTNNKLSGARPALPMGVAPEAMVGCLHPGIGSKAMHETIFAQVIFAVLISGSEDIFPLLMTSLLTKMACNRQFVEVTDLTRPAVGPSLHGFRNVRRYGAVIPFFTREQCGWRETAVVMCATRNARIPFLFFLTAELLRPFVLKKGP